MFNDPKARLRASLSLLAVLAILVFLLLALVVAKNHSAVLPASQQNLVPPTEVNDASPFIPVAVMGDSFSGGTLQGGQRAANWASLVANEHGWRIMNVAVGGTGYVHSEGSLLNYELAQLPKVLVAKPKVLIVEGSRNDAVETPASVDAASKRILDTVRSQLPYTKVVVVGPIWSDAAPPPALVVIRDRLKANALESGALWIDPIAEAWFAEPLGLIGADGVHPTNAGHALMASRIDASLRAAGL